jgi:hypothetical protein
MADCQLSQIFTNMSTQATKVVASNVALQSHIVMASGLLIGVLAALIVAVTWKG